MIQKNWDSETGLSKWFGRPSVEHMWHILKTHFTTAHTNFKTNHGPTLHNTAYHQANDIAAELNTNFERLRDKVLTEVHALVEGQYEAPPVE